MGLLNPHYDSIQYQEEALPEGPKIHYKDDKRKHGAISSNGTSACHQAPIQLSYNQQKSRKHETTLSIFLQLPGASEGRTPTKQTATKEKSNAEQKEGKQKKTPAEGPTGESLISTILHLHNISHPPHQRKRTETPPQKKATGEDTPGRHFR